jgi:acetylornithine/succinyldiaminopimelate/putrescine aminotransferase
MFYLLIQFVMMGQIGLNVAFPFPDQASCEKAIVEAKMMSNVPLEAIQTEAGCVEEDKFLKMVGERKA